MTGSEIDLLLPSTERRLSGSTQSQFMALLRLPAGA
jgi:hypothetical protein